MHLKNSISTSSAVRIYHFLGDDLWDFGYEVKAKLNGTRVLILPLQLFRILDPQLKGDGGLLPIIVFIELHPHACILGKECVIQEVLDGVPEGNAQRCLEKVTTDLLMHGVQKHQQIQRQILVLTSHRRSRNKPAH